MPSRNSVSRGIQLAQNPVALGDVRREDSLGERERCLCVGGVSAIALGRTLGKRPLLCNQVLPISDMLFCLGERFA